VQKGVSVDRVLVAPSIETALADPARGRYAPISNSRRKPRAREEQVVETYNIYMDEAPAVADANGDEGWEVEFLVVGQSIDDGDPENNAVLAGLDLVDLINLRDALQQEIDNFALTALEAQALIAEPGEELMP
jgi:hypothetical protein